ncbi:MAG TPA: hypothetical protein VMU83_02505 [Hanamia sp.]|nr:hypothetical protein [Hanamia sp.]
MNYRSFICLFISAGFVLLFQSCKKDNNNNPSAKADVYVAGNVGGAVYWKNGVMVRLADSASANSIFVSGNDVYVAGSINDSVVYWKNGIATYLGASGAATSIFVSGSDVYLAASVDNSGKPFINQYNRLTYHPTYWKNSTQVTLSNDGTARSIFVSGTDVYVAGSDDTNAVYVPTYWKNQVPTHLQHQPLSTYDYYYDEGECSSVFVSGADIYLSGTELYLDGTGSDGSGGDYWKNGKATILADGPQWGSVPYSIFVSEGNVFIAGYTYGTSSLDYATYWKNGTATQLPADGNSAFALGISVLGNDIYVAGYEFLNTAAGRATLWKNSVPTILSDSSGFATAVFVK